MTVDLLVVFRVVLQWFAKVTGGALPERLRSLDGGILVFLYLRQHQAKVAPKRPAQVQEGVAVGLL